ncbi:MAG: 50S ribosome-binding GTPase [Phycisphaeraceae bacterium]|nr:50S ribosome-binding GTPase [Phycisphaeraceae bacterium]
MPARCQMVIATSPAPGAIGIIQLHGPDAAQLLFHITHRSHWPTGRIQRVPLAGLDDGLAVRLRDDWAQLMPHGGPRVMSRLIDQLAQLGATLDDIEPPARDLFPEAESDIEAEALTAMSRAASPAAVDVLLSQPRLWRQWADDPARWTAQQVRETSEKLDHLLSPATVVVVGRPNVGKSTLTNRLLGKDASVVADLPGTTRDWVGGMALLRGVAVHWLDTPGLRHTDDPIEQQAIVLAREVLASAEVIVAMRDLRTNWPDAASLPRPPQVWVVNTVDDGTCLGDGTSPDRPLAISAQLGVGETELTTAILTRLGLEPLPSHVPWAFGPRCRELVAGV